MDSLSKCTLVYNKYYICEVDNIYISDAHPTCLIVLINKVSSKIPERCNTKFIYENVDIWKKLNSNYRIFVQSNLTRVLIDCLNSKPMEIKI